MGEAVVTHPVLEEIPQDVEGVGAGCRLGQEPLEARDDRGTGRVEMQVRDEKRAGQTTSAFSMVTAVVGTSPMPRWLPVATALILSTVSVPSTTLPNTA
jgi:hypothetical protein